MWYKNPDRSEQFFRFVTMHAFDGQTDRQNSHQLSLDRVCILCSAVKKGELLIETQCVYKTAFYAACEDINWHG